MKVVYEVYIEDENYDTPPTRIELIFSELTTLEEKILKEKKERLSELNKLLDIGNNDKIKEKNWSNERKSISR